MCTSLFGDLYCRLSILSVCVAVTRHKTYSIFWDPLMHSILLSVPEVSIYGPLKPKTLTLRYPLAELLGALRELYPRGGGRFVLFEYVMLAGVNDSEADAARLAAFASDVECKVNLIIFNAHDGTRFAPSSAEQAR